MIKAVSYPVTVKAAEYDRPTDFEIGLLLNSRDGRLIFSQHYNPIFGTKGNGV